MKKFLSLTIVYILLLLVSFLIILEHRSNVVKSRHFKNFETESNLLVMNSNENFDMLFIGISHARNFSRHKNHLRVENILDKKVINIGQGNGFCGVNELLFYLDYFYSKGNTVSTVVYFISPPLFFSETLPVSSNTFDQEPFELGFLLRYLFFKTENKSQRISSYLQTKHSRNWISFKPFSLDSKDELLDKLDSTTVSEGQQLVYGDSLAFSRFNKSIIRVEETIQLALDNNSKVILIIPPALFGKWKGHNMVENFAKNMLKYEGVKYYDFSESVMSPEYYYDHHHLNTKGVVYFTENYLKPVLSEE